MLTTAQWYGIQYFVGDNDYPHDVYKGHLVKFETTSLQEAKDKAKALAEKHPGRRYYVVSLVYGVEFILPQPPRMVERSEFY